MAIDTRPTTLTAIHNYNLRNQGWPNEFRNSPNPGGDGGAVVADPVAYTQQQIGVYPSNADIIYGARTASAVRAASLNTYSPWELEKQLFGNTPAAKGHFIIKAFDRNRQTASGIPGIYDPSRDQDTWRPISTVFHAGRIWYLMQTGELYFSQTLTEISNSSKCYQEADPTAEEINDLVATDGGKIDIAGVGLGLALQAVNTELAILANNGVWTVSGTAEGGFTATDQEIQQITNIGILGKETVVEAEGVIYYWSTGGIYALAPNQVNGTLQAQNISETTIQDFYLSIPEEGKQNARVYYDDKQKKIYWMYNDESSYDGSSLRYKYNKILILDLTLQAFYKYSFPTTVDAPFFSGIIEKKARSTGVASEVVTVNGETVTVDDEDLTVNVRTSSTTGVEDAQLKFVTFVKTGATSYQYTFSELNNSDFKDWADWDGTGEYFNSYLITGHDILEDLIAEKEANTIYTFFKRTEMNVIENNEGGLNYDFPSGCYMQGRWQWADSQNSGRFSESEQVYRLNRFLPGEEGAFDYGFEVVQTINQVRGKGRALSLKFESEQGKDFHLLGWSIPYTVITGA